MMAFVTGLGRHALLAQDDILRGIRKGLNTEPNTGQWLLFGLAAVGLIALLFLAKRFLVREAVSKPKPRPDYLAAAADVLDFTPAQREDVKRLAGRARLPQPTAMLLSPQNLAHAYAQATTNGPDAALRQRMDELSRELFGVPLPDAAADSPASPD